VTYATERNATALARLQELAGPELYWRNTFRITSLPTDATHRTIRAQQRREQLAGSVGAVSGAGGGPGGGPALPQAPTPERLRAAFEELRDPQRRIVDELFWLWDTPDATCPCPRELHQRHDEAVRAHARALDMELTEEWTDPDGRDVERAETLWAVAGRTWTELLGDGRMREHLRHRVHALDDRRLDESVVDVLLDRLPRTLLMSVAALPDTVVDLEDRARLCAPWTGLGRETVDEVLEEVLEPVYESAASKFEAIADLHDARRFDDEARLLEEELVPVLVKLQPFATALEQRYASKLCQAGSTMLNNCAVALLDESAWAPPERVGRLLDLALRFAVDAENRERIAANKTYLPGGAAGGNHAGTGAHAPSPPGLSVGEKVGCVTFLVFMVAAVVVGVMTGSFLAALGVGFGGLAVIGLVGDLLESLGGRRSRNPYGGRR